jgi:D-cysteine desulfhydrase
MFYRIKKGTTMKIFNVTHFSCLLILTMTIFFTSSIGAQRIDATQKMRPRKQINSKLSTPEQKKQIPLYKYFPALCAKLPHVTLTQLPTPIERLSKLEKIIGTKNIFIKRDDLTSLLFGGNKTRKLEFLFGDALNGDARTILTRGFVGSNHAAATALHAQQLNLQSILCFIDQEPTAYLRRNLLLDFLAQAQFRIYDTPAQLDADLVAIGREHVAKYGLSPYYIPSGGSNEVGVIGYINAALELKEQITQGLLPEPDLIYVALGSGGTVAGLLVGLKLAGLKSKIVAIRVDAQSEPDYFLKKIITLCTQATEYLTNLDPSFPQVSIAPDDFVINNNFLGDGYAIISEPGAEAVKLLQEQEKIMIDGTYVGKAFAALLHDLATQPIKDKVILFWNTFFSGDLKNITDQVDYHALPDRLHGYFECSLQPLDQGI